MEQLGSNTYIVLGYDYDYGPLGLSTACTIQTQEIPLNTRPQEISG
jgi:hypothetical protein